LEIQQNGKMCHVSRGQKDCGMKSPLQRSLGPGRPCIHLLEDSKIVAANHICCSFSR